MYVSKVRCLFPPTREDTYMYTSYAFRIIAQPNINIYRPRYPIRQAIGSSSTYATILGVSPSSPCISGGILIVIVVVIFVLKLEVVNE